MNLTEATVNSYNTVYAQLILEEGPERAIEIAHGMGITRPLDEYPSAVLGANDVQPLEMASAYATLANRGVHVDPVFVTSITRADGTILYESEHRQQRVLDAGVADQVTAILEQAVQRGTGEAAQLGRPVAGKTGTAQGWRNAWFCGYVPQLATAVWVGFAGAEQFSMVPPRTPIKVTGGSYPARIWRDYMSAATEPLPVLAFPAPPPPPTTTTLRPVVPVTATPTTGAAVAVPSVVGATDADASQTLLALGFRVRVVQHAEPGVEAGRGPGPVARRAAPCSASGPTSASSSPPAPTPRFRHPDRQARASPPCPSRPPSPAPTTTSRPPPGGAAAARSSSCCCSA